MKKKVLSGVLAAAAVFGTYAIPAAPMFGSVAFADVAGAADVYESGDWSYTIRDNATAMLRKYLGSETEVTIPKTIDGYIVESVNMASFYNTPVRQLTLSENVTEIYDDTSTSVKITGISVVEDNPVLASVDGVVFTKDMKTLVYYPAGRTDEEYAVPEGVTQIGGYTKVNKLSFVDPVYGNGNLKKLTIPAGVTVIKDSCNWLTALTELYLPDSLTSISGFNVAMELSDVYYTGSEEQWKALGMSEVLTKNWTFHFNYDPEASKPEETKPEETKPEETKPEETKPEKTKPEETKPEETKPEETKPEETKPEETKPEETKPEESKPAESTPTTTTPTTTTETSTPAQTSPTSLKNSETGVELEAAANVIPTGAELKVEAGTESDDEVKFDITLEKDGKAVQPDGKVTVKIPVPEKLKDKSELYVYYVNDGKYTLISSKTENGYVVFETDHFSTYVVSAKKQEEKPAVATGAPAIAAVLGAAVIAGGVMIVTKKRR